MYQGEEGRKRSETIIGRRPPPTPVAPITPPTTMTQQLQTLFALMQQRRPIVMEGAAQPLVFQKSDGLSVVGNNGRTEVRIFHEDTKVGPYTRNFIDRGRSIFDAALVLLDLPKGTLPPELMTLWDNFSQQIKDTCNIDPVKMTHLIEHPNKSDKYFENIYERALYLLNQLCVGLIIAVKSKLEKNTPEFMREEYTAKYAREAIRKKETELIKSGGRSNLVHVIDLDTKVRPTQLVSCLSTVTPTTTPSNITSEGNRNLVREDRYIKMGEDLIKVDVAIRLGAISSFDEENEMTRKLKNAENALELLQVCAEEKITSDGLNLERYSTQDNPLVLNIFSSTLLSPYKEYLDKILDRLEIMPGELPMLLEHHEALMLYHNRIFHLEVSLNNGVKKTIYIKPNIKHFNVPANINVGLQHNLISDDQDDMNAQGGFEYLRETENFLMSQWLVESQFPDGIPRELQSEITQLKSELINIILIIYENKNFQERLQHLNTKLNFLNLTLAYENNAALENLNKLKLNPADQRAAAEYYTHIEIVKNVNKEIFKSYREVYQTYNQARKQKVEKEGSKDVIALFNRKYMAIENILIRNKEFFSRPENFTLKQQLLVGLAYINAQRIMFDEDPNVNYKYRENALLMIAYMHATMQAANNINTYGCKSAKDRTGLLTNYKDAITVFAILFDIYPDPNKLDHIAQLQNIISYLIYDTPSAVNSSQNDPGAYGLQIHEPFDIADAMGLIAKAAYSNTVGKKSVLQSVAQGDQIWQKILFPRIRKLIEMDVQFSLSGQRDLELAKKIIDEQNELKRLCNSPDLFNDIKRWSAEYLPKKMKH